MVLRVYLVGDTTGLSQSREESAVHSGGIVANRVLAGKKYPT